MKAYFVGGSESEQFCSAARVFGYEAYVVGLQTTVPMYPFVQYTSAIEDLSTNVVFIPEHTPVSSVRKCLKNAKIVVVWRNFSTGVIENIDHEMNMVTQKDLLQKVKNSVYVPEYVHDAFHMYKVIDKDPTKSVSDSDLRDCTNLMDVARILSKAKTYTGTKYAREAFACGCEVDAAEVSVISRDTTVKKFHEVLTKLDILTSLSV